MYHRNAAIIAIGTEITSGQIKNAHAAWVSARLDDYGITTTHHVAVPDDHKLILDAFEFASKNCEFIFITGGLGPTRDDFTRNVVGEWLNKELVFDEQVWHEIHERLTSRKVKVSPSHKNQCYFPEGSHILSNSAGTAPGFYIHTNKKHFWVLPGPTPELQAIWIDHIKVQLSNLTDGKKYVVKKWRCLGLPESEAADLTEAILEGSGLQTGYRLDSPCVEVKVWVSDLKSQHKWIEKLDHELSRWTISKDEEDIALTFLEMTLKEAPLVLIDDATQGQMSERLMNPIRQNKYGFEFKSLFSTASDLGDIAFDGHGTILKISAMPDVMSWNVSVKYQNYNYNETITFESVARVNTDRIGKIKTELTLKKTVAWLRSLKH